MQQEKKNTICVECKGLKMKVQKSTRLGFLSVIYEKEGKEVNLSIHANDLAEIFDKEVNSMPTVCSIVR